MSFPTLNLREEAAKVPSALMEEVRSAFLERAAKSADLYNDEDVAKVKANDWWVTRFVANNKQNKEKAIEALDKAMKWRKEFGVLGIKDNQFPKEFYQSAALFLYGKDLNGARLLILRAKVAKKIKVWVLMAQQFFVNLVEKAELADDGKGERV